MAGPANLNAATATQRIRSAITNRCRALRSAGVASILLAVAALPAVLAPDAGAQGAAPLSVVRITPAGDDVPAGRQIVLQFNRAVVPLGRMSRKAHEIPVRIQPRVNCQWRWLEPSALACELAPDETLAPATQYRVAMDPGIVAADGATLTDTVTHTFITERPQVNWVSVYHWLSAQRPVLRVTFNQAVTRDSVRAHLFFAPSQQQAPQQDQQQAQQQANNDSAPASLELAARQPAQVVAVHPDGLAALAANASPAQLAHAALLGSRAQRRWLVVPRDALGADREYVLVVEPGLRAAGPQGGVESRAVVRFATFAPFAFGGVRCTDVDSGMSIDIAAHQGRPGPGPCDPLAGVALLFTAPVDGTNLQQALNLRPEIGGANADPWTQKRRASRLPFAHRRGQVYPLWLPQRLRAHRGYHLQSTATALTDVFARPLSDAIDMHFGSAHRRPLLHVSHPNAVLESAVDSEVPVYVTNLDALQLRYSTTFAAPPATAGPAAAAPLPNVLPGPVQEQQHTQSRRVAVPKATDIAFALPLPVRALLAGKSGAVHGTITPEPADRSHSERRFFAQVTPFAVTVKLGHFSSVAWVTRLDDGTPVSGAALSIYSARYGELHAPSSADDGQSVGVRRFITDRNGIVVLPGASELDADVALRYAGHRDDARLFVRVEHDGDLALLPLDNDFRVWTRDVWPSPVTAFGHLKVWGTTAQGIYRAGDTVQYKLWVRHQDTHTLVAAPASGYQLSVTDPKGEVVLDKLAVRLNAFGAFDGELPLPANAAVGWYRFQLHSEHGKQTLEAFRVLVSDFTPSPFKVRTLLNGEAYRVGDVLRADTLATLHAGGPYTDAQARITVRMAARALRPEHPLASRFHFDTHTPSSSGAGWQIVQQDQLALNARGERSAQLTLADYGVLYGRVQVESAVQDDRGKSVAAIAGARFSARDRFVGLRSPQWLHTQGETGTIEYLVVDESGAPVDNVPVSLLISREEVYSARVKGAGNSYQTRYEQRWVDEARCAGRALASGSDCHFTPQQAGRYRIRATIADTRGRVHETSLTTWVQGSSSVVWQQPEDGALSIIAERERYQVGDTARYLLRNPWPGAMALVTIERYGILRSWTQRLDGATPVIEFEVQPDDLPGFHLSVTVMSPRVQAPPPQRGQVDLGKPAMRMGYVRVPVDDPHKRLRIAVTPRQAVYKPRQRARIDFQVREWSSNATVKQPVELAVVVLDEAVFDLIGAGSRNFDPYQGFYALDDLDVISYALLTRLVGRQKFEAKGASSGGDGGAMPGLRDLFKFVSYWNPSLAVDADGRASVEVELPDNLTGWRVLALAATAGDRLGLGEGGFKVNKDTELRPVMPNQLQAGDRFTAGFTVLNRSAEARTLQVTLRASGDALGAPSQFERAVLVPPFARERVSIELLTNGPGEVLIEASAGDERDADRTRHRVAVRDTRVLKTLASYGDLTDTPVQVGIAVPEQALTTHGAIAVLATPSVISNTAGAFEYMRNYPYMCWEQRLSKGVMASHYQSLKAWLPDDLSWPDSAQLPAQTLGDAQQFQAPNGGMSYWIASDERVSPYLSAFTAIAFDWLQRAGNTPPAAVQARLDGYLRTLLKRNALPDFYDRNMTANVRAIALAALARRQQLDAADVLRVRAQLPRMSVFAKAHLLEAAYLTLAAHPMVDETLASLLAHGQQSAGKYALSSHAHDGDRYLLETPARANCAALSSLVTVADDARLGAQVRPLLQKMVRSISAARGRRDHWQNTQENAFCMAALADYARRFEADTVDFTLRADVDGEALGERRFRSIKDQAVAVSRPLRSTDPGRAQTLTLSRAGSGRAYWSARLSYALPDALREPVSAGMHLRREFSVHRDGKWVLLKSPITVARGERLRVDLYLSLPTARHFVVVDDPVPGALEPINTQLATGSVVDAQAAQFEAASDSWWYQRPGWRDFNSGRWSFYHQELRHDAVRFFSDWLPAGDYHLSYAAQVIAVGDFGVQPALAQEMYDPDIHATGRAVRIESREAAAQ